MKKILKVLMVCCCVLVLAFGFVACDKTSECSVAEKVTLAKTTLGEVEFENSENVKLEQDCDKVVISGEIDAMSTAQVAEFGVEDVSHVVVLKYLFDKERTISSFEIKGETTKVFSTDETDENYVGSISDLLDSESDEDAFCYLILSANTKEYSLKACYSDDTCSTINVSISATLLETNAE